MLADGLQKGKPKSTGPPPKALGKEFNGLTDIIVADFADPDLAVRRLHRGLSLEYGNELPYLFCYY